MDYRITQCPRCGTSFRVTDAHLAIAAGAVRCGSCLHIFNAREHWVEEQTAEDEEQEQVLRDDEALEQQALAAASAAATVDTGDGDERFGDENDDDLLFSDDPSEKEPSFFTSDDDRLLFLDGSDDRPTQLAADDNSLSPDFLDTTSWSPDPKVQFDADLRDNDDGSPDDAWAEQLLVEDDGDEDDDAEPTPADPLLDEFDDIIANTPITDDSDAADEPAYGSGANYRSDYHRNDHHHNNDEWRPGDDEFAVRPAAADQELQLSAEFLSLGEIDRSNTSENTGIADGSNLSPEWQRVLGGDDATSGDDTLRADDRIGDDGYGGRGSKLLGSFEPEPLQLHRFVREPRWPKLLWGLGLVAGVLLLIGQYVYFNFPTLSRGDSRPLMAQLCTLVGCTLPSQSDLAAIRTSSLIVRSHPTRRGALAIDAILTNTAKFKQPYPNLLLQFTDINGEPVAGGIFRAADYLGGELAGDASMPVQQPVHVGLVIADPGNRAVNYQLLVSPP